MRHRRKQSLLLVLIILVAFLGIGYAYLTTTLTIAGTADVDRNTWNVFWDNVQVTSGSVTGSQVIQAPTINSSKTTVSFRIRLKDLGEFYEFTVDAKNTGTLDAMISTISKTTNIPAYLKYTVTYSDDIEIAEKQLLSSNSTETYKVRVEYKTDVNPEDLPATAQTVTISFDVTYVQADGTAITVQHPTSFTDDSWDTIIGAVQRGNTSAYSVGDTKEVNLGSLGTHTLRIANKSTPAECNQEGFSQTACGFVLEFADIINNQKMYSSSTSDVSWSASTARTYANNTIYNALPETLRNAVMNTMVTSSYGPSGTENSITTDKLYFLATHEVWEDTDGDPVVGISYYDTSYNYTRQLDYYSSLGVNTSSYSRAVKYLNTTRSRWWFRSAYFGTNSSFYIANTDGSSNYRTASQEAGVSPAFRIG